MFVDLETGKLVSPFKPSQKAADLFVLPIAYNLEQINASSVLKELKRHAVQADDPNPCIYRPEGGMKKWRSEIAIEKGLKPKSYKRIVGYK